MASWVETLPNLDNLALWTKKDPLIFAIRSIHDDWVYCLSIEEKDLEDFQAKHGSVLPVGVVTPSVNVQNPKLLGFDVVFFQESRARLRFWYDQTMVQQTREVGHALWIKDAWVVQKSDEALRCVATRGDQGKLVFKVFKKSFGSN